MPSQIYPFSVFVTYMIGEYREYDETGPERRYVSMFGFFPANNRDRYSDNETNDTGAAARSIFENWIGRFPPRLEKLSLILTALVANHQS